MPDINGLELARGLTFNPLIVFATVYKQQLSMDLNCTPLNRQNVSEYRYAGSSKRI
ncbi:hypothetical protein HGH93_29095 [Chitinophaga polysaccharea]|uniref:hypothetical protein n=1 Tax=Chitinophaga TaxID=79328 RepID=UPI0014552762|nr:MULTISPECIES: hypothetical protein [Chitinophaga]NLR62184.1 hypothetical protein [Chitinophaga polysaccharea]NLU95638.1 hypothetical protein [Chitinophaga sp. Ak27]